MTDQLDRLMQALEYFERTMSKMRDIELFARLSEAVQMIQGCASAEPVCVFLKERVDNLHKLFQEAPEGIDGSDSTDPAIAWEWFKFESFLWLNPQWKLPEKGSPSDPCSREVIEDVYDEVLNAKICLEEYVDEESYIKTFILKGLRSLLSLFYAYYVNGDIALSRLRPL